MSRRPWLSFGVFVPMLAALLLVIAVSCGGGATSTAAPQPESVAPAAEPAAEPEAAVEATDTEKVGAAEVRVSPTATPVPVPEAEVAAEPEVVTTGAEPYGTLNTAFPVMPAYVVHPRVYGSGGGHLRVAHENLFRRDSENIYRGLMVKEWSVASDNRTWTFELHKGIQFHDGWGELTPEDVIWSVRELGADDGGCGCAQTQDIFDNPDGYWIALDNYTLELDTVTPAPDILSYINYPSGNSGYIISKKQWDTLRETLTEDEASSQLVGTGPFKRDEIRLGEVWSFKAVQDHWRKTPEFAELRLLDIPEESTALANFLTGKIDTWTAAPDSLPKVAALETTKFMSLKGAQELVYYIWQNGYSFTGTDKQWSGYDPDLAWIASDIEIGSEGWERARKVREAIGLAIDREKIVDELLKGEGEPGTIYGWATYQSLWQEGWEWPYDPERSKQLLKEAGYEDGFDVTISNAGSTGLSIAEAACESTADMLQDVGINAIYKNVPNSVLYPAFKDRTQFGITCQAFSSGWNPLKLYRLSYSPDLLWGVGWDHPEFTKLMDEANQIMDYDKYWEKMQGLGQWMRDNALGIGIYSANQVFPLGPKLDSWVDHLSFGAATAPNAFEYAIHRK